MKRRIISFLLALAMMVSLLPTGVFSIQSYAQETDWEYTVNSGEVTITGYSGAVTDLVIPATIEGLPVTTIGDWAFSNCDSLTSITIPDSVTSIGYRAFSDCYSLTSITIPDGVTTIGSYAFSWCTSLSGITIPDGVTTIDRWAFSNCSSLTSITIPDSVTTIGDFAFEWCDSLTSVTIGNGVTTIGDSAFIYCESLTSVTIGNGVTTIGDFAFECCDSLTSVTIPSGVTSIGYGAFGCCYSLTTVYYGGTEAQRDAIAIGDYNEELLSATWQYKEVVDEEADWDYTINGDEVTITGYNGTETDLVIPSAIQGLPVTAIGDFAFYNCDSLTSITIPDGVTTIGVGAFEDCDSLTGIWVDANNPNYSSDDKGVFFNKDKTTLIQAPGAISGAYMIPDGVTTIGDSAFEYCDSLTSITIPDGVTTIGDEMFAGCTSLTSVAIPDGVTTIGDEMFAGCTSLTSVAIPDSVTSIGDWAFASCDSLTSITIPDGVTTIGVEMFVGCTSLTSVTIPDSVTTIGDSAFSNCDSLTGIWVDADNPNYSSDDRGVLLNKDKSELIQAPGGISGEYTIPDSVTSIGDLAFYNCDSLTGITIPDGVTKIGSYAFNGCDSLTTVYYGGTEAQRNEIAIASGNENLLSATWQYKEVVDEEADWDYTINGDEVTITGYNGTETDLVIPSAIQGLPVTAIGNSAFRDCSSLTSITIPDSVTTIGSDAFSWCTSLTGITIPDSVTTIGDSAFELCTSLTGIWVDADNPNYSSDDKGVFFNKDKTTLIQAPGAISGAYMIPDSVTTIGERAFAFCDSLTSITIPDSVTTIGSFAFSDCSSLTGITIPDSVTTIGSYAFYYCEWLTSITIPDGVTTIGDEIFAWCDNLTSVTIGNGVTTIGSYAFFWCDSLTSITIPDSVTTIGDSAFSECWGLTTVYYGGTEAQRDAIEIDSSNWQLMSATWHYKEAATTITAQPEDAEVALDKYAEFSVAVSNSNVTYQWQYKAANSEKWLNSTAQDATTAALRVQMKAYRAGQQYRCVITTADGEQLISEAATMTVKSGEIVINSQPVSVGNAVLGKTSQFTVDAATLGGEDISYQWYVYNASKGEWERSYLEGYNTATLTVSVTRFRVGLQYKCVITSGLNEVETDVVTLNMQQIVMEEQNAQFADKIGGNAVLSVNATGNVLKYQWYFSNDGETWKISTLAESNTNVLNVKTLAYRVGQIYRCKITDVNGQVTWSDPVALTVG